MNQLLYPLLLQLESASNIHIPKKIVWGLASQFEPEDVNKIMFQYKIWKFISEINGQYCKACGTPIFNSRTTSGTCSPRCHKIVKRHQTTPIEEIQAEAEKKLQIITKMASVNISIRTDYPWHKLNDGWTYVLHD